MRNSVLLIDDEEGISGLLKGYLRMKDIDMEVIHASTGEEGVKAYRVLKTLGKEPLLTFVDIRLPGIDGFEVLDEIREENPNANVLILTGFAHTQGIKEEVEKREVGMVEKVGPYMLTLCSFIGAIVAALNRYGGK